MAIGGDRQKLPSISSAEGSLMVVNFESIAVLLESLLLPKAAIPGRPLSVKDSPMTSMKQMRFNGQVNCGL
jgi:hypothetical protein